MRLFLKVSSLFIILFAVTSTDGLIAQGLDHSLWDMQLRKFVDDQGQVNYKDWNKEQEILDRYLAQLSSNVPAPRTSTDEALTYWINAYNAFTVKLILKHYPVQSIMDIYGAKPWDQKWIELGGKKFSLNQIEHEILRKDFNVPEIHFAVNCAAKSCPPLWNRAFQANKIREVLSNRALLFINDVRYNTISTDVARLSSIFTWYQEDFGDLRNYLNRYSHSKIAPETKIQFRDYDWALNAK